MKLLRKLIILVGLKKWLYKKQPKNTTICFPLSIHNAFVYKGITPPSLRLLKTVCGWTSTGTIMNGSPDQFLEKKLGLVPTKDSNQILMKGGILIINNEGEEHTDDLFQTHATLCHPSDGESNIYVNAAQNLRTVEEIDLETIYKHLPPFKDDMVRGYYFKD